MEGFICIKKRESLMSLEAVDVDVLVLTEETPFAGYYHERPDENVPMYLFLPLSAERTCYEDEILRTSAAIKKETGTEVDARFAAYTMYHKEFPCMRLEMDDLSGLQALVNRFRKSDLKFEPKTIVPRFESFVRIKKYSKLEERLDNVFQDVHHKEFTYVRTSKYLSKEDFSKVINSIHGSGDFTKFDAAQASFFTGGTIIEMVRVYTKSFEPADYQRFYRAFERQIRQYV